MSYREGIDCSYAKPSGAELKHANRLCAVLYITDPGPGNKGITQEEYDDYAANGVVMAFVWELGTSAVLDGYERGVADATRAQHNLNALHGPSNRRPIYFAIDFDIQPNQYTAAGDYFRGVNSVIGARRTGAYGHHNVLSWLAASKLIAFRFQTYAWSDGIEGANAVYQYDNDNRLGSGTVDFCRMYAGNWGQKGVLLAPAPKPAAHRPQADPKPREHLVADGETLSSIAAKYHTTVTSIVKWNTIKNKNLIFPGQWLRVG